MILNTGNRTDIPAFYSEWLVNRMKEGSVLSRNPYYPAQIKRYRIDPDTVDIIGFGTKNPAPMLDKMGVFESFRQFWSVTITPYGKDIEPGVPPVDDVIKSFKEISKIVGKKSMAWRYDPIFISEKYTLDVHIDRFRAISEELRGYTDQAVISFIDLYEKTRKNFPEARAVRREERLAIGQAFAKISEKSGMRLHTCLEGRELARFGIDTGGCLTQQVLERAFGEELRIPGSHKLAREGCQCVIGNDIGVYNTCRHFCKYCYANYDRESVIKNSRLHDPDSPLLIGSVMPSDEITDAVQESYMTGQLTML